MGTRALAGTCGAAVGFAVWLGACSPAETHSLSTGASSTAGAGGAAASSSASAGSGGGGQGGGQAGGQGGAVADAGSDAPFVGMPFDCDGCTCDGATHLCMRFMGGGKPPPRPAFDCGADGGPTACVPIPAACLPVPTCECVNAHTCGGCYAQNGGLFFTCSAP